MPRRASHGLRPADQASPFARLRSHLATRGRARRCRVLLIVANPLGNAIGDTVMAAAHVPCLHQLAPRVHLTIWSGNAPVWRFLDPTVRTVQLVSPREWTSFDVIVVEGRALDASLLGKATRAGAAVLHWMAGSVNADLRLGRRKPLAIPLPPAANMQAHIGLVYEVLGFPKAPPPRAPAPRPGASLFFNPFASNARRSLSPAFTEILLDALLSAIPGTDCVVQPRPVAVRHDDVEGYARLSRVLSAPKYRGRLSPRAMDLSAYCRQVARSALVIGADTSSQHLAAAAGRPSIAFYPPTVSVGFYLMWGPTGRSCLHFSVPPDSDAPAQRALARLVVRLAISMMLRGGPGRHPAARTAAHAAARALVADGLRYLEGDLAAGASMEARLVTLRRLLRGAVMAPILRELEVLRNELLQTGPDAPAEQRGPVRRQLDYLNSLKVLAQLAGGAASERPAAPRSSADRAARSRGRALRSPRGRTRAK